MPSPEHDRLVGIGARWFRKNGFPVVITELFCFGSREQPDVLAFRSSTSAIIEVKVSRADFFADRHKPERSSGGLGEYRFYLCPEGLIKAEELPPGWGLLYATGRSVTEIVKPKGNFWPPLDAPPELAAHTAEWVPFQHQPNARAERQALFSIARRLSKAQSTATAAKSK